METFITISSRNGFYIYRPLLLGLTAAVIVGQVLRVTHLSGDTMIHGSNSIPQTASRCVFMPSGFLETETLLVHSSFNLSVSASDKIELQIKFDEWFHFLFNFFALSLFNFLSGAADVGPCWPLMKM